MHDLTWTEGAYAAEFATADALASAVRALEDKGYTRIETYSPVPLEPSPRRGRSRLPVAVFVAGLVGAILSYGIQWYADAYAYPIDIGGRPVHAGPAFVPTVFETVCLVATLAAFAGFLSLERLPRLWQPLFDVDGFERAAVDRFWLELATDDTVESIDRLTRDVMPLEPLRIVLGRDT